jgi:hypothetical protein
MVSSLQGLRRLDTLALTNTAITDAGVETLARAFPDLVELEVFEVARHTKLWNYDEQRWSARIRDWVRAQGLTPTGEPADS